MLISTLARRTSAVERDSSSSVIAELREGYEFLRYTEHAIQAIADRQTQMLPEGETDQARVAYMLGFADWQSFHDQLTYWRGRIDWHFRQVIADPDDEDAGLWRGLL